MSKIRCLFIEDRENPIIKLDDILCDYGFPYYEFSISHEDKDRFENLEAIEIFFENK